MGAPLIQRLAAEARYFAWVSRTVARPVIGLLVVYTIGAVIHHEFGGQPGRELPTWSDSFFISYCLLLLEHLESTPAHPLAQLVHYLQPLAGVVIVSEGVLRLGIGLLDREQNARVWVSILASTSQGHVIVCGLGSVGFRVVEELRSMGQRVFAIDRDAAGPFVERARELGVSVLIGDARAENLLRSLNVGQARAVIVATNDDLANLEIALDLRELRADVPIVMRCFDQRLADKVKASLGVQISFSTSRLAAPLFATAALHRTVVGTHRVGDRVLATLELSIVEGSSLDGATIAAVNAQGTPAIAFRGGPTTPWTIPPSPEQILRAGSVVHLVVPTERVDAVGHLATTPGPRLRIP